MRIPHDSNTAYVVIKLLGRGFSGDDINRALLDMVGDDWQKIQVTLWHKRLEDKGFIYHRITDIHAFVDEIEILMNGKSKLNS